METKVEKGRRYIIVLGDREIEGVIKEETSSYVLILEDDSKVQKVFKTNIKEAVEVKEDE